MYYREIAINASYMVMESSTLRGVQRYTKEVLHALDKHVPKGIVKAVTPYNLLGESFENIEVVEYAGQVKNCSSFLWNIGAFQWYIWRHKAFPVILSGWLPYFSKGICGYHDIRFRLNFWNYMKNKTGIKHKLSLCINMFNNWISVHRAKAIITVSEFSKSEIVKFYRIKPDNIYVCYNAWQHLRSTIENGLEASVFEKFPQIKKHKYYFILGGREENKNIKWVLSMAEKYPERMFIFAGPKLLATDIADPKADLYRELANCIYIGFVSNEDMVALMANCRAFLFPSTYEGFGIPPLEAIACGAKVFMSNATCLPEIYQDFVSYFDPYDYSVDLDELETQKHPASRLLLEKYSWEKTALQIKTIINKYTSMLPD